MDLQALLRETAEHPPCGPDLEYDPAFLDLAAAAQGKPEQDLAGTVIPAVEPDWPQVRERALALLSRSKDLRVAMQLVRALTRTEGLRGFVAGVELINELLGRYWANIHPLLDVEDNNDPTLRLNALAALEPSKGSAAEETLLRDLREAEVVPPTPQGRVRVRDLLVLDGRLAAAETPNEGAIEGLLRSAIERDPTVADVAAACITTLRKLRGIVAEHVEEALAPDVSTAIDMLKPVVQRLARLAGRESGADSDAQAAGVTSGAGATGPIRSREDVARAIDAICAYLERTEPTNPAPLLLRRAQRLLNKSFVEVIADLAPDGVPQVKLVAGLKDE